MMDNRNNLMQEFAERKRLQEEAAAQVERLRAALVELMTAAGVDTLAGTEHKATYKQVTTSRLDSKALRAEMPEVYEKFTTKTTANRFTFV